MHVRLAEVSGIVVAELAGFGKTMLVAHFLGPSPSWPLVIVVIDEAHTFFHERKGTARRLDPQRPGRRAVPPGRGARAQRPQRRHPGHAPDPAGHRVAIPTRIRDNCQVATSFATRTLDDAVAALGEEIRHHPDASPVLLNDPAHVGVAVTSLPGRPGFHRVRTPQVDHHQVAAIIRASAGLRADPVALLAEQALGLRVVSPMLAPRDAA